MYIPREIEATIDACLAQGKVVLITGARQVGKTTALKHHLGEQYNYVSLENPTAFALAKQDAVLFFQQNTLPLIIDEVQRVPELFSPIKWQVDQSNEKGQIVLSGSQTYHLMQGVSESLAGRIRILEMPPLSLREIIGLSHGKSQAYIPRRLASDDCPRISPEFNIWEIIQRGTMPELQDATIDWNGFYADYEAAYLERDVRDLIHLKDELTFYRFMVSCAARSGQLLNASNIANDLEVDHKTVKSWLSILQASNIIRLLYPFWPNIGKRLTKTPKIYFMDTGLVCHLTGWNTAEQLCRGAAAGHVFETFVVAEVLKSYMNAGANLRDICFYRDAQKHEIDLVIQEGHVLHPVEVKTGALIKQDAIKSFACLEGLHDYEIGFGQVICQTEEPYLLSENVQVVPAWAI